MSDDLISVVDFAREHGTRKQSVFKIVTRLGIKPEKRRSSGNRGQLISYLTAEDSSRIRDYLRSKVTADVADREMQTTTDEQGCVFYLLLLEPDHDPGRFKVGIADNLPERLRQHRCSAPLLKVLNTWPCKRLWEKTAIDCAAAGCERVHTEVFRTESIESVVERCTRFFDLMPKLPSS
jgi:hypothetical protein